MKIVHTLGIQRLKENMNKMGMLSQINFKKDKTLPLIKKIINTNKFA